VKFEDDKVDTFSLDNIFKEKPKLNKYKLKQQKKINQEKKKLDDENSIVKSAQSWKNFNKKLPKKKAVNDKSQFKTSDSLGSRVGVVNSGKPMTETKKKERVVHRYNPY